MSEKYAGLIGRFHLWKESLRERWSSVREEGGIEDSLRKKTNVIKEDVIRRINHGDDQYDHLYRRKTRWELTRISAAVMGIEFSYAAETAFVSPTLLKIGVRHEHMTLIWCLSPLVGFFLTPIMGSLSDRCRSNLGRRRPFIIMLSIGVVLGLILVPNGKWLGKQMGDRYPAEEALAAHDNEQDNYVKWAHEGPGGRLYAKGQVDEETKILTQFKDPSRPSSNDTLAVRLGLPIEDHHQSHPWGIFFTVLGTVLLDFDADSCQSPSRAYLLDVTVPDDHAIGLSTFTIMAGLGGSIGYLMGGMDWGWLGVLFGGHVRLVFTLVLFLFIGCVGATLTSFAEIPLEVMSLSRAEIKAKRRKSSAYQGLGFEGGSDDAHAMKTLTATKETYGSFEAEATEKEHVKGNPFAKDPGPFGQSTEMEEEEKKFLQVTETTTFSQASPLPESGDDENIASFTEYLWSIVYMPSSLRVLCITNLFCWSSLVCYSLYFTDFVGEAVFKGDPSAAAGSDKRRLYDEGVRFGCWGMAMYSFSCSCYSLVIESLVKRFRAKPVYICGQLVYSVGMVFMAMTQSKWGVLLFSWAAGVMYSTLFTMPYLLVAHYHENDETYTAEAATAAPRKPGSPAPQVRGIGTDIAIVSCMVFLAQFILSLSMGSIISYTGSTVSVIVAASVLSFCGAVSAYFVTYHEL